MRWIGTLAAGRLPVIALAFAWATLAAGCAGRFGQAPAEREPLRLSAPDVVRWEQTGPRVLPLALENPGREAVQIAEPDGTVLTLTVVSAGSQDPVCRLAPPPEARAAPVAALAAGARRTFAVDLAPRCGELAPGEYRYELAYAPPPAAVAAGVPPGVLRQYGTVVVRPAGQAVELPARRGAVSAPAPEAPPPPLPPEAPVPNAPADAGDLGAGPPTARTGPSPASIRACVDAELARRGLNAYGDPPSAAYREAPPVPEDQRIGFVLERYPDLRSACRVGPW